MHRLSALAVIALVLFGSACGAERSSSTTATPTREITPADPPSPTPIPTLQPAQPPIATPAPNVVDLVRADLAARLNVPASALSLVRLEGVVWPDGCLGLGGPGVVCTQALVPGWLAVFRAPNGLEYRYRGAGERFALEP